jgi:thymidylate synthase
MINLIAAVTTYKNKLAIGKNGNLLFKLKDDMKFFKQITENSLSNNSLLERNIVLMGRKTYFSIPQKFRPLSNRINLVLTRDPHLIKMSPVPVNLILTKDLYYTDLETFYKIYEKYNPNVFVIGGSEIYNYFMEKTDKLYITHVQTLDGKDIKFTPGNEPDTFINHFTSIYKLIGYSEKYFEQNGGLSYRILHYNKSDKVSDEYNYLNLMKKILDYGNTREDRTGTGTVSLFGTQMRFDISQSIPLLTTKRVPFKTMVEELLWFCRGDSVTEDTPILIKDKNNNILIKQIKDIFDEAYKTEYPNFKIEDNDRFNKEKSLTNYLVWTDTGYSKIKKVIRHKVKKQIYRINTHCGSVDVTEDHSLFDENGNIIKPSQCTIGTKLLTHYPEFDKTNIISHDEITNNDNLNYSIEEKKAFIYGFFYGDGSCGIYKQKSGYYKSSWALNNSDVHTCNILKQFCEDVYLCNFSIYDTIKSSGAYKIYKLGKQQDFVLNYRNLFYQDNLKIIPDYILNSDRNIKLAFLKGYYLADGTKKEGVRIRCDNKGKIGAAQLFYLFKSVGFNVSIYNSKRDIFRLNCTFNNQTKVSNEIKEIIKLPFTENFVYDLETERGRFQAGVGDIIVKNTDAKILQKKGIKIWDGNTSREFLDNRGLHHYDDGILGAGYGWQIRFQGAKYSQNFADTSKIDTSLIGGFDQLAYVEHLLKTDPFSRRIMMCYWNPSDFDKTALLPCHYSIQFYVTEEKGERYLSSHFIMRSNDVFLGSPVNISSYSVLTYILALKCNLKPKELVYSCSDTHIYQNHINQVQEQMTRVPRPFPKLKLDESIKNKNWSDILIDDFDLIGYMSYPSIKAPMAI